MNMLTASRWMPVVLATMAATAWTSAAKADDADYGPQQETVRFADLELRSVAGAATLYRRLGRAAEHVCGGPLEVREPSRAAHFASCKEQAIERAVEAVNSTALTNVHLAKIRRVEKPITTARVPE